MKFFSKYKIIAYFKTFTIREKMLSLIPSRYFLKIPCFIEYLLLLKISYLIKKQRFRDFRENRARGLNEEEIKNIPTSIFIPMKPNCQDKKEQNSKFFFHFFINPIFIFYNTKISIKNS